MTPLSGHMQGWTYRAGYVERLTPAIGHPDADHPKLPGLGALNSAMCSDKLRVRLNEIRLWGRLFRAITIILFMHHPVSLSIDNDEQSF